MVIVENRSASGCRGAGRRAAACWAVLLVVISCAHAASSADPFGDAAPDFNFYFSVRGYEADSWFGEPTALALDDRSGLIYVADRPRGVVDAFSIQGIPKFQYTSENNLKSPLGLAVDRHGDVCVSENAGSPIKIIDSKGNTGTIDLPSDEDQKPPKPGRMTFDREGNLYVVDRVNCQVYVFDKKRKFKFKFGGIGEKRGEFKMLQDVAVDYQGRIYTLDSVGVPVQMFDREGGYLSRFGVRGEGERQLSFPVALFVDRNDQIWVTDRAQHCLKVFDRSGGFLRSFGSHGLGEGSLFHPVDADIDNFGRVYVLEGGARRLQVFSLNRPFEPFRPPGI